MIKKVTKKYTKELSIRSSRLLLILIFCFISLMGYGQSMSIASFKMDEADQTANVSPTMRTDINGEKCALIKIATTQKNFSFDVGSLGITHTEWQNSEHPGEIWLYVPNGVMKISIQHPQFGSIKDYDLGGRLKKGRTYVMDLTSDQVNTLVVDYDNSQILDIDITPHDADLYINGLKQSLDYNGHASITLPFGTHNYRVIANNYHPEESQIIINDKENKQNLSIRLKQAFGYLNVNASSESKGGELYIDDIRVGTLPISQFPLKSGMHHLSVYQKLYLPYTEKVAMTDSATVTLTPLLKPNYAEYEIVVDGDKEAQIYDNGELIGTGHWKGRLEAGEHIIEAKKANHISSMSTIVVQNGIPRTLSLSPLVPIVGSLNITTTPGDAIIFMDDKKMGNTPYRNDHTLVGNHKVRIIKPGYKEEDIDIEIHEGKTTFIEKALTDFYNGNITSIPSNAELYINGVKKGSTPFNFSGPAGSYKVTLNKDGYQTFSKNYNLNGTSSDIQINLKRNYIKNKTLYLQTGYGFNGFHAIDFGAGAFLAKINIEANYMYGLASSDIIHWWDSTGTIEPFDATYTPQCFNIKLGYGIKLIYNIRLTPQIGAQMLILKEKSTSLIPNSTSELFGVKNANSIAINLGVRLDVMINSHFGVCLTPSYNLPLIKSEGIRTLSQYSSSIDKYNNGLGLVLGVHFNL